MKIYTASKTSHADKWKALRADGWNVISTWIDEAGIGETECFTDLWHRCISEAAEADYLIVYREPGEVLKGAFVEVGAALASGRPVLAIGCDEFSFTKHVSVYPYPTLEAALSIIPKEN
ncbi:hypothetical protein [Microvirga zambiensis]|uniref:hypothetical protein n=1 Tax=Microvirga zambiensis TaxID=1402137 RepID=UPI00191EF0A6|nr:hypothetical protein [Microvirga zambiensis]